jgi:Raf kinase inhibitor-like YbhB/YbcL family protein
MRLHSDAFSDGATLPKRFTCDGADLSPPLDWSELPTDARSLVVLCDDPDAPMGTWHHWAAYDIPAERAGLAEGAGHPTEGSSFRQAMNDFHRPGYGGACPPRGGTRHHYEFKLIALSTDHLGLPDSASCRDVEREARKYALAEAKLVGIYGR